MLYLQNGDRIVTIDSVTSLHLVCYATKHSKIGRQVAVIGYSLYAFLRDTFAVSYRIVSCRILASGPRRGKQRCKAYQCIVNICDIFIAAARHNFSKSVGTL